SSDVRSLMWTISTSGWCQPARRMLRPMRPKPLMAMRMAMVLLGVVRVEPISPRLRGGKDRRSRRREPAPCAETFVRSRVTTPCLRQPSGADDRAAGASRVNVRRWPDAVEGVRGDQAPAGGPVALLVGNVD